MLCSSFTRQYKWLKVHEGLKSCLNWKVKALFLGLLNSQQILACWDILLLCFPSIFFFPCNGYTGHRKAPKATLKPIRIHSIITILQKSCSEWLSLSPPRFKANPKRSYAILAWQLPKKKSRIGSQTWQLWSPAPIAFREKVQKICIQYAINQGGSYVGNCTRCWTRTLAVTKYSALSYSFMFTSWLHVYHKAKHFNEIITEMKKPTTCTVQCYSIMLAWHAQQKFAK